MTERKRRPPSKTSLAFTEQDLLPSKRQRGPADTRRNRTTAGGPAIEWSVYQEAAARLIAEGVTPYDDIAAALGLRADRLRAWRTDPDFQRYVHELSIEMANELLPYIKRAKVSVIVRAQEIVDELWDVAKNSKSGQARVAALNSLATIAGLLHSGGGAEQNVNVQINNRSGGDESVEVVEVEGFDKQVIEVPVGRRDVE